MMLNLIPHLFIQKKKKNFFRNRKFDFIIAIGGGSVIDTAKALKVIFSIKKKINLKNIIKDINNLTINNLYKLIVLPTTSGTGSEVTPYATIWDEKNI